MSLATDSRIGQELAAYRIESLIGRGGMGVVYCAQHVHLERRVALKLLSPKLADNEEFRRRFIRESRTAASIRHPNIVTVFDAGEADGLLYIAMQLVEGTDLSALLKRERVLEPHRALEILEQVAGALDSAHQRGLVHRDVKPANIMLDDQTAYLTDFGLTKRTSVGSSSTSADQFLGTIDYVAPEQIAGKELDGRTDVYALGCVLYECLTGEVPYRRDSEMATLYAHMHDPPPKVSDKRPDLPEALDDVLARALAKDREDRQPTCADLVSEGWTALAGSPERARTRQIAAPLTMHGGAPVDSEAQTNLTARLTTSTKGIAGRLRRRPGTALAVGVLVAFAGAAFAVFALSGDDDPTVAPDDRTGPTTTTTPESADTKTVEVGRRPTGLAVDSGGLWVANMGDDSIARVDPEEASVKGSEVPAGDNPIWMTASAGRLWVANSLSDTVTRIDPTTGDLMNQIRVGDSPTGIAGGFGTIWVANEGSDTVSAIATSNPTVATQLKVGDRPRAIATTSEGVWIVLRRSATVVRLDGQTRQQVGKPIPVGRDPAGIAIGSRNAWVTNSDDDTVTRISTRTGRPVGKPIPVGRAPYGITIAFGSVWVANSGSNTVTRLSQRTGRRIDEPIPVGKQPLAVKAAGGYMWVTNNDDDTITRIEP